ncbi:MAG TPA: thioesterase II family protein [Oculatellaceae cyanobacterium]|jgi:medium-chain acyl-[acyl-carrier-protein] hydrolase
MLNTSKSALGAWVTFPQANPQANLRLFCLPYAGGSSVTFRTWSNHLPKSIEICPIELPGRGSRFIEAPFTRLDLLVEAIASSLLPYLDKPFAFFGHSMGAVISFELTRLINKKYGLLPAHLLIAGRHAPQLRDRHPPIHTLPKPAFIQGLCRYKGMPKQVLENTELMEVFLPILRADFAICETYKYIDEPPLPCPITAFGGLQDSETSVDELEAWHKQTNNSFSSHLLPGDHFFIQSDQLLLLQLITQTLT